MAQHMSHYEFLLSIMKMEEISVGTDFSDEMDYPRPLSRYYSVEKEEGPRRRRGQKASMGRLGGALP